MANKIGFIGGGNMARALITGMRAADYAADIYVVDNAADNLTSLQEELGCSTGSLINAKLENVDVIVIAVKPHVVRDVCDALRPFLARQLVISVAAGLSTSCISRWLGGHASVIRAMPNTPALARSGVTGLFASSAVSAASRQSGARIFETVGRVIWFEDEAMIDAVTGISGSGPAYVFYLIESLIEAAKQLGFDDVQAQEIAEATVCGAVALLQQSGESATVLRQRVTSKGGTTAAAISTLESWRVMPAIVEAARSAATRAADMRTDLERLD